MSHGEGAHVDAVAEAAAAFNAAFDEAFDEAVLFALTEVFEPYSGGLPPSALLVARGAQNGRRRQVCQSIRA